jgi:hypothetical protein
LIEDLPKRCLMQVPSIRQLLLNRLLLVEAGLARVEQRFAQDSRLGQAGFELEVPP